MDATNIVLASVLGVAILAIVAVMLFMAKALDRMSQAMSGLTHKFADQSIAFSDVDLDKLRIHLDVIRDGNLPPEPPKPVFRTANPYANPVDELITPMPNSPIN